MKSLELTKPHIVIMVGIPGAGKSFFAEHFAESFKAPMINLEKLRHNLFESPTYDKNEDLMIEKIADNLLNQIIKTDRTIVYVGQTNLRTERIDIAKKFKDLGYEPLFVWVQTEPITARKRAHKVYGIDKESFNEKLKKFTPPHPSERAVVISGKHTYSSQIKIVLKRLIEPREKSNQSEQPKVIAARRPIRSRNVLIR